MKAVGQFFVIDAEEMQHRGVQVVDVHSVFNGVVAEFVRVAVTHAARLNPETQALQTPVRWLSSRHEHGG